MTELRVFKALLEEDEEHLFQENKRLHVKRQTLREKFCLQKEGLNFEINRAPCALAEKVYSKIDRVIGHGRQLSIDTKTPWHTPTLSSMRSWGWATLSLSVFTQK